MALKLFAKFTDYTLTVLRLTRIHPVNNIFGVLSDIGRYNDKRIQLKAYIFLYLIGRS